MAEIILGRLKFKWKGAWAINTSYIVDDIVKFNANSFVCVTNHTSSATTDGWFTNDYANWQLYVPGINSTGLYNGSTKYYVNDIATYLGNTWICTTNATVGHTPSNGSSYWTMLAQGNADLTDNVYYVDTNGSDTAGDGKTMTTAWASLRKACSVVTGPATIYVRAGTYYEQLPITVPASVNIIGDSMRDTQIAPKPTGLSTDASPVANNLSTMFLLSDATLLQGLLLTGMTGFSPAGGGNANDITQATVGGVYLRLNPASPVSTKSPYIKDCTSQSSGGVGAIIDGSVHASGNKSMVFWAYNMIMDNGVGLWCKDNGKSEAVSCFTYYAYFGYSATGGGKIRSLSGNNSYGTYGVVSRGYDVTESAVTGTVYGNMLTFATNTLSGGFAQGEIVRQLNTSSISLTSITCSGSTATAGYSNQAAPFVTGQTIQIAAVTGVTAYNGTWTVISSGATTTTFSVSPASGLGAGTGGTITGYATAYVTSVQTTTLYYKQQYGAFNTTNQVTGLSSNATMTPNTDGGQNNYVLVLNSLSAVPLPGASIQFTSGDTGAYVIQSVSTATVNAVSLTLVVLAQQKATPSTDATAIRIRYNFSQIRLTGHDFLSIGTGGTTTTNYPGLSSQNADQSKETVGVYPGRVYYVSTDQDGNFRVGPYFAVNQATGATTLNASSFNLSGLTSLRLGSIGAQLGAQINEFSTDGTLSQNSAVKVPTQSAIVTYLGAAYQSFKPATDLTYDLGDSTHRWRSLYVGAGSIQIGTLTISDNAGTLQVQASGTNAPTNINSINNGTSNITVTNNGSVSITSGGTLVATYSSSGVVEAKDMTITGNLTVNGTTTTLNTSTLSVDDKNIELASVPSATVSTTGTVGSIVGASSPWTATITGMDATSGLIVGSAISATNGTPGSLGGGGTYIVASIVSGTSITYTATGGTTPVAGTVTTITTTGATDVSANGAGITIKGTSDKTFNWVNANTAFTSSENLDIATGKTYKINAVDALSSSAVLPSAISANIGGTATTAIGIGTNTTAANTVTIGGAITGNTLKLSGTTSGTINFTTDVTTGTINIFSSITTATVNIGSSTSNVLVNNIKPASTGKAIAMAMVFGA